MNKIVLYFLIMTNVIVSVLTSCSGMKRNNISIFIAIISACLMLQTSCRKQNGNSGISQPIEWNCEKMTADSLDSKEIFKTVTFIPLETTDKSLMGHVDKAVFCDSIVFVMDKMTAANICAFNAETGNFLWKIGSFGKGRGEYIRLCDFSIDKSKKHIYVLSERNKMMQFDLRGKFIGQKKLPFYSTNFEIFEDKYYFVCGTQSEYNLYMTDTDFNIQFGHFPMSDYGENYVQGIHPLFKKDDGILYTRHLDNNVYKINNKGEVSIEYAINLGRDSIDFSLLKNKSTDVKELIGRSACDVKYFYDGQRYAYIMFLINNKAVNSIYDKKDGTVITCRDAKSKSSLLGVEFPILEYNNEKGEPVSVVYGRDIPKMTKAGIIDSTMFSYESNPILCIHR